MRYKKAIVYPAGWILCCSVIGLSIFSTDVHAHNQTDIATIVQKVAALATTPRNVSRGHEDWSALKTHFPQAHWKEVGSKDFPVSKSAKISKNVAVTVHGARSMILSTELTLFSADGGFNFWDVLKRSIKILETRCDSGEKSTYAERFLRLELPGLKAVNAKYESSAGSAGITVTIRFTEKILLPRPGAPAIDGNWTEKCN